MADEVCFPFSSSRLFNLLSAIEKSFPVLSIRIRIIFVELGFVRCEITYKSLSVLFRFSLYSKQRRPITVSLRRIKLDTVLPDTLSFIGNTPNSCIETICMPSFFEKKKIIIIDCRCVAAKGEEANECERFARYYRALCPGEWVSRILVIDIL